MPFFFHTARFSKKMCNVSTFGRRLAGWPDQLENFEQSLVLIEDEDVIAKSGKTQHPIVKFTGLRSDRIDGTVFVLFNERDCGSRRSGSRASRARRTAGSLDRDDARAA